ncbi:CocE/NonD family hydrolase [Nocardioides sp. TF02-7]|uniref:CocE/NonD family hydrolase n=1 Tax=Nocardioides sp. TF02-7 TaxID=2917724 RepID=UPI001F06A131|nr:CocE/NonD family hydrolase [Nocardioides sp. TF02-7]UMG94546.1 CocE/NonD family hydrolase [Nocardioides sp. TF02-7]
MPHHRPRRRLVATAALSAVGALLGAGLVAPSGGAAAAVGTTATTATTSTRAPAPASTAARRPSAWKPRPARYAATVTRTDIPIRMDDGVVLRADLELPAGANGRAVDRRLPVIVTITAYNKSVISGGAGSVLAGADPDYLVKRGYAQLTVDARGTGASGGVWKAFSARENKDAGAIVTWAHRQPWSNGKVGMTGASYMGISQLFAAGRHPKGLKGIFPQVPAADVYRDVVASGGQVDVGFIPLWMGLVTVTGLVPPAYAATTPDAGLRWLLDRLTTATTFTGPLLLDAVLGGNAAYDSAFYRERSPIEVLDDVRVPTFLVGGQFDLFQRGTPLVFERLQRNGAPVKMIFGPWDHLQGSSGAEVGRAGYGSLAELQLRWFDHWIKGRNGRLGEIAPLTYYEQGSGRWVRKNRWLARDLDARTYALSGTARMGGKAGALRRTSPAAGRSTLLPLPVSGLCSRSANQWTAGILNAVWPDSPCLDDHALNDLSGLTFQTAPVKRAVRFQGPINARLHVSSPSGDGMLSVVVEDVAPNGKVSRITGGWQVISHRKLAKGRSRFLDGRLVQPYHPHTKAAKKRLRPGQVAPVDVEIFPTGAVIRPGHRLRLSIQGYDVPHLLPHLGDVLDHTVPITLHTGPGHRSVVTLPVR